MMFLEADLAIYKRLTGYPLDQQGRPALDRNGVPTNRERIGPPDMNPYERDIDPVTGDLRTVFPELPSFGIRIPMMKGPFRGQRNLTSKDPDALRMFEQGFEANSFRQIPVFDQNIQGRNFNDVWPCVSFRWMGLEFDPSVFVYHDPFCRQDSDSVKVNVTNKYGDVVDTGYMKNLVRPHPESWKPRYAITAWAKETIELELICAEIIGLFPAKGAIKVELASGEIQVCDMFFERMDVLDDSGDQIPMTRGPEEQRGFARQFVYTIETYFDNTTNKFGTNDIRSAPAVLERLFELDKIMGDLAIKESAFDLNKEELTPIT